MSIDKIASLIGFCKKSGNLILGANAAHDKIASGRAKLILIDELASDRTQKTLTDGAKYYNVAYMILPGGILGQASGSAALIAAVTDSGFARSIQQSGEERH